MRNYEVTFIVDPTLSSDEIKSAAKKYVDTVKGAGKIVHIDEMGLRQLAYPIKRRNTGIYYCVEFEVPNGEVIPEVELAMTRDDAILRFLSVRLDKHGVKYNEDKRAGKIGKIVKKKKKEEEPQNKRKGKPRGNNNKRKPSDNGAKPKTAKPATKTAPKPATTKPAEVKDEVKA